MCKELVQTRACCRRAGRREKGRQRLEGQGKERQSPSDQGEPRASTQARRTVTSDAEAQSPTACRRQDDFLSYFPVFYFRASLEAQW